MSLYVSKVSKRDASSRCSDAWTVITHRSEKTRKKNKISLPLKDNFYNEPFVILITKERKEVSQLNSVFPVIYLSLYRDLEIFISFVITNEVSTILSYWYILCGIEGCISVQSLFFSSLITKYLYLFFFIN